MLSESHQEGDLGAMRISSRISSTPAKVLIVDDLDENLIAFEALLRQEGVALLKARSGTDALELLLRHEVAVALIDVRMPEMDGFELAEMMRSTERTRRIPIILITADHPEQQRVFRGYEAGAVDFLFKPVEPRVLRGKVDAFLELHRHKQRLARQHEIAAAFVRVLSPEDVARVGLPLALQGLGGRACALHGLNASRTCLELIGAVGLSPTERLALRRVKVEGPLALSEAVCTKQPVFIQRPEDWARRVPGALETAAPAGTQMALPLLVDGQPLGCLSLELGSWHAPTSEEQTFLRALADQFAQALERVRLFEAEREARQALSRERDEARARAQERDRLYRETQAALRMREDFIAMTSHDIRSPLSTATVQLSLMRAEAAKQRPVQPDWLIERVDGAHRGIERAVQLMDDLLQQARAEAHDFGVELADMDLFEAVHDHLRRLDAELERSGCAVTLHGAGPVRGHWDRLRIDQAFGNLLSNAVKYGAGKPIVVRVEPAEEVARVSVTDHGPGIPVEEQTRIFEKFRRASTRAGTTSYGLGLWIVKRIVTALGGQVRVDSQPHRSTTFTMELPYQPATAAGVGRTRQAD